jgi:hypothetical protein
MRKNEQNQMTLGDAIRYTNASWEFQGEGGGGKRKRKKRMLKKEWLKCLKFDERHKSNHQSARSYTQKVC